MGKTILVVDDEVLLCEILADEIRDWGDYHIIEAHSGSEAIEILKKNQSVNAIISDVRMPHGDGIQLLDHVRKNGAVDIPFFLVSGYSDSSVAEVLSRGACALFAKPIDFRVVKLAVERNFLPRNIRWNQPVDPLFSPKFEIKLDLVTPEQSQALREFAWGRGGIAIRTEQHVSEGSGVGFSIHFAESNTLRNLNGAGVVVAVQGSVCLIEILNLKAQCLQSYLEWLSVNDPGVAFIASIKE